jgi:PAS domain S-box-containing protein
LADASPLHNPASNPSDAPAWLWDAERLRIVWANEAGLAFFGAELLFDLIDQPFDASEAGPRKIREVKALLAAGETRREVLSFPSAGTEHEFLAELSIATFGDGRPGVMVRQVEEVQADVQGLVFDALPQPVLVLSETGVVLQRNPAAEEFTSAPDLAGLLGAAAAQDFLARMKLAGTVSGLHPVFSRIGPREVRVTLRRLADGAEAAYFAMLEDVTDRRALERQLVKPRAEAASPAKAKPSAPSPATPRLTEQEQKAFADIGKALKPDAEPLVAAAPAPAPSPVRDVKTVPQVVRTLFDSTSAPILITRNGQVLFANARAQSLLADGGSLLSRSDIAEVLETAGDAGAVQIGGASYEARGSQIAWYGGPARQFTLKVVDAAVEKTEVRATEVRVLAPAPAPIPAPASIPAPAPVKPAAAAPSASDEELRAILETASDGIITLDSEGLIGSFSGGAEAMFGVNRADAKGRPFSDLLAPESRKVLNDYLSALSDQGLASVFNDGRELVALANPGGSLPVFMTISRLGQGFCAVVRDITQWKKTETELRLAKDTAEKANAQKSEFLARISHELRTPLNAILGFSEVMRLERFGEIGNERYRGYVNDIHTSGSHLLSLINDLLDLSKVEAGKLELTFTNVSLAQITDNAMNLVSEPAQAGRVILRSSIPTDLPHVVADQRSMQQIMLNLLSNAVKFTEPGGQVIISAKLSGSGELAVRVKDTGIGMSEPELKEALEPFRRVARDRPGSGTGLGLPLTKALAEANRARFSISSEPGKGTLVEITFPTTRVLAE